MIAGAHRTRRGRQSAAQAAQRLILEQHRELRRLLAAGLVQTCAWADGRRSAPAVLRALVERIRAAFVAHLADEEAALLPLFADARLGGPGRVQVLREQHARQRAEMEILHALCEAGRTDDLADRFDRLARALLVDIAEEERELAVTILDDGAAPGGACRARRSRPVAQPPRHQRC